MYIMSQCLNYFCVFHIHCLVELEADLSASFVP